MPRTPNNAGRGDLLLGPDDETTEEKVEAGDFSEAKTTAVVPVQAVGFAGAAAEVEEDSTTSGISLVRRARATSTITALTGVLVAGKGAEVIEDLLTKIDISSGEEESLLRKLSDWGGPDLDLEVVRDVDPDLLKKIKIIEAMKAYIPGSSLLIEHYFVNDFEALNQRVSKTGVALKVDLSGFTSTLKEMEGVEGDASGLSPLINADLDRIAEFCTAAGFKLVSLGGDAATFVYFGEDAYMRANPLRRAIADLSRCHADKPGAKAASHYLHHDFKVVAVYGPIEMFPVKIGDNKIFRVGGDAVSTIDDYEKKLSPGQSTMEVVPGYSVPTPGTTPLLEDGMAVAEGGIAGLFPALTPEAPGVYEFSTYLDELIDDLSHYLRPDISLVKVVEGSFRDSLREHSTVIISMKGLRDSGESEDDYIAAVSKQAKLYGGVVYKVEGDVLIALFPKHIAGDSYVKRAYEFSNNCMALNDICKYAMTTGKLLESLLGPRGNQELGVLGIAVNRAARILSVMGPGSIGMDAQSEKVLARLIADVQEDYMETGFKGLDDTRVFKVKGVRDESSQPVTRLLHGGDWAQIVGRSEEVRVYKEFFDRHRNGSQSEVVYLKAESGMGKNLFLANAFAESETALNGPLIEHESDLFKRPYSACFGFAKAAVEKMDGGLVALVEYGLTPSTRDVLDVLIEGRFDEVPADEVIARALIDMFRAWAQAMRAADGGGEYLPRATLLLGKISFWDPQSLKVMSLFYDYFKATSEMRMLFVFTDNTSVQDTRVEERKAYLDKFEADAAALGGAIDLSPLSETATKQLILEIAQTWEPARRGVHQSIVSFIYEASGGNPARIRTLAGIVFDPASNPEGKTKSAIIEGLKRSGALKSREGVALSYIDYLGFERPEQVKQFVQVFALLGNAFPLEILREIVDEYVEGDLEEDLEYVLGVLASRGILKIDGEMVSFKHSGQRADFRDSIAKADKKAYLKRAVDGFVMTDASGTKSESPLIQISKFHWLKELVEIWNGDGDALKQVYVGRMLAWAVSIVDNLSRKPGNQMSVIYYADEVVKKLVAVAGTGASSADTDDVSADMDDTDELELKFSALERALSVVYAGKPTVAQNYCELAVTASSAYLGNGNLESALVAERMLAAVENLATVGDLEVSPEMTVKSIVGQIRAQVWRGRHDEEERNRLIKATSERLVTVRAGIDEGTVVRESVDKESYLVSAAMLCVIDCIHQKGKEIDLEQQRMAIASMQKLIGENAEFLARNVPLHTWMLYLVARLHGNAGMADRSTGIELGERRNHFALAIEELQKIVPKIEEYPDKTTLCRLFPNVVDVYVLGRQAASYFQAVSKPLAGQDGYEAMVAPVAAFEREMAEEGCKMAEQIGVQKSYIQALESKIMYAGKIGDLKMVEDAANEIVTVAEMISDFAYLANGQYVKLLLSLNNISDVNFVGTLCGGASVKDCQEAFVALPAEKIEIVTAEIAQYKMRYGHLIDDKDIQGHLGWVESLLAS